MHETIHPMQQHKIRIIISPWKTKTTKNSKNTSSTFKGSAKSLKLAQELTRGFTNHLEQLREHLDDDTISALVNSEPSQQIARVTGNLITIGNGIKNGLTQEPPKP